MLAALKSGAFVEPARIRRVCLLLLVAGLVGLAALIATSDGARDYQGRPLGSDFSNVYAAGAMARDGRAALAYDWGAHHAEQKDVFDDPDTPFYGWHYPPFFLIVAILLSFLPYTAAWLAWMAASLPAYLAAMTRVVPARGALVAAAAFPAVFINILHGQNGFLTAALIGAAMLFLDRRPLVAGLLIGLLAYKPQFGVFIPLVLAATGRWRCFVSAGATVLALAAAATALFGAEIWTAFIEGSRLTRTIVLEAGDTGWHKMQSLFAALRAFGAPLGAAYAAQAALALALAASLLAVWRSRADFSLKAAALILASLLATPYLMDYDLVALAPGAGFLIAHGLARGFAPYEKSALAFAFLAPLAARPLAEVALLPIGLVSMLLLYGFILRRAHLETRSASPGLSAQTQTG